MKAFREFEQHDVDYSLPNVHLTDYSTYDLINFYSGLMNHVPVGLVVLLEATDAEDGSGEFVCRMGNLKFANMTGLEYDDIIGTPLSSIKHLGNNPNFRKELNNSLACSHIKIFEIELKIGFSPQFFSCQITPITTTHHGQRQLLLTIIDKTSERSTERQLQSSAINDQLTGLPNRVYFAEQVEAALEVNNACAIILINLDRFQAINETFGHVAGDELLSSLARRLLNCMRAGDTLARLSGDEFGILLKDMPDMKMVTHVADRIHNDMTLPFTLSQQELYTSVSIGITSTSISQHHAEQFLCDADFAVHTAKAAGRGCTQIYQAGQHKRASSLFRMESELRLGIKRQEFELNYQPVISLHTGALEGFEALIRWNHPEKGRISPLDFIPVAEDSGLIVPIGQWVIEETIRQTAAWRTVYGIGERCRFRTGFNLSVVQLARDDIESVIFNALDKYDLPGNLITLEITESALVNNPTATKIVLDNLKLRGISIAIDDFGTGYSSLSYLQSFPIDIVKIDRSFVTGMLTDNQNYQIVNAIISLAHNLGKRVVAEGIEEQNEALELDRLSCAMGQGYYFHKPLSLADATLLIAKSL